MKLQITPARLRAATRLSDSVAGTTNDVTSKAVNFSGRTAGRVLYGCFDPVPDVDGSSLGSEYYVAQLLNKLKERVKGRRTYTLEAMQQYLSAAGSAFACLVTLRGLRKFAELVPDKAVQGESTVAVQYADVNASQEDFYVKVDAAITRLEQICSLAPLPKKFAEWINEFTGIFKTMDQGSDSYTLIAAAAFNVYSQSTGKWAPVACLPMPVDDTVPATATLETLAGLFFDDLTSSGDVTQIASDLRSVITEPVQARGSLSTWSRRNSLFLANALKGATLGYDTTSDTFKVSQPGITHCNGLNLVQVVADSRANAIDSECLVASGGTLLADWTEAENRGTVWGLMAFTFIQLFNEANNGKLDSNAALGSAFVPTRPADAWLMQEFIMHSDWYPTIIVSNGLLSEGLLCFAIAATSDWESVMWTPVVEMNSNLLLQAIWDLYTI